MVKCKIIYEKSDIFVSLNLLPHHIAVVIMDILA